MRQYPIRSRYISLLLLVAMLFSLLPAMQFTAEAATGDVTQFTTAEADGITMLNNGNQISLPIKVNNFALDGLLFDYLSSTRSANNADHYYWEYSKDNGRAYIQLYPYWLTDKSIGDSNLNIVSSTGVSGPVQLNGTLDASASTTGDTYGSRSDGAPDAWRPLTPSTFTDGGGTTVLRLTPDGIRDNTNGNNPNCTGKHRAWTKLTTFVSTHIPKVDDIRYAVLIYRLPTGTSVNDTTTGSKYTNMGLTVNYFDEAKGSCSRYVTVNTGSSSQWQYAIVDLMGLSASDNRRILSGTKVTSVYLQTPLSYQDSGKYMDLAGVAYFPYYGDAEQFAYYGVTMGCQQKYFNANNAGFSLRNNTNTHYSLTGSTRTKVLVKSLPTFWNNGEYLGSRPFEVNTYDTRHYSNTTQTVQSLKDVSNPNTTTDTIDKVSALDITGTNLFGIIKGQATLGMVESALDKNGRPVFKESVVHYLAAYLRHQLLTIPEYPYDNYGWRNYSFITGVSTTGATNEALFGTNSLGQSMDLASALCAQIGVKKGGAITSYAGSFGYNSYYNYSVAGPDQGYYGSYANTLAHKDELIGTWDNCKQNIHTWFDAAYFLLHNLYVTETDSADTRVDGYGEYENDYQTLIMPQVQYKDGTTPYFFDSGYAYYTDINDNSTYSSALTFDKTQHTISLNGDAQGAAQFNVTAGQNPTSWFPFLITSGNGTAAGESNSSYYLHDGVISRDSIGTTYRNQDFHYSMSGQGYFAYEPGLYFNFQGDDDVYVFINGQLVVDLGGTHGAATYEMTLDDYVTWAHAVKNGGQQYKGKSYSALDPEDKARVDALCLTTGSVYSFDFFYMERHGVGSNLRIMTNMKIVESNLGVDKFAYQNGIEIIDNGMANANEPIEYGFSITNNSGGKLYDLSFQDAVIGVTLDPDNGLQVTGNVTDAIGAKLTPASLVITVDGYDASGNKLDTINVSCPNNEALIQFLKTLSAEGTEDGAVEDDFHHPYSGSGLWKDATVTVRGIYYRMTEAQKQVNSFTNSVVASGFAKAAGENGALENYVLRGIAKHTIYQPGQPAYYQWVGHSIVVESERLYQDLVAGKVVESAADLPKPVNMILIPSNSGGTEIASSDISNVPGGDVYLKINFTTPGSYMAYVTIRDATDPTYSMTVPITVYAMGGQDSTFVLDYGLDTYLTDNNVLFEYELDAAAGNVDGSVLGIADSDANAGYVEYDEDAVITAAGQIANNATVVSEGTDANTGDPTVVYELDEPVFLDHNKPWVIEWKALHDNTGTLLFSGMKTSGDGNVYVFLSHGSGRITMGEHSKEHIDINGTPNEMKYNSYGVQHDAIKNALNQMTEFKLVNVPDGAGGNMIYAYVGNTNVGAMTEYYPSNANSNYKTETWLSGKDFTFNFLGTTVHPLNDEYEYIRVYEDGYQLTHYKWEMPGTNTAVNQVFNSVDTGKIGYVQNSTTYGQYTVTSSGNHKNYWALNQAVTLAHDENWEVTLTAEAIHSGTILMGAQDTSAANATHIYFAMDNEKQFVHMGYKNPTGGSHTNYGVDINTVIPGFSMMDKHTYVLKNVVLPTGGNMVYLYVDDTYIGPLNTKYRGGTTLQVENTNEISGMDFTFHTIACNSNLGYGFFDDTKIYNLEINSKTALHNSYEWVPGGSGLRSNVITDTKGNQIMFTNDADGKVETEDGTFSLDSKGLKFSVTDVMDGRYSAYVAMVIHEKGFAPTALAVDGIDIGHEVQMYKKITVLPANVVYYEDDFPAIHYYGSSVNSFTELGNVSNDYLDYSDTKYYAQGSSSGLTQNPDQNAPYGSDGVYRNTFTNTSGGSLHTIAINNDGPLAWFKFKGTGFELDARTSADKAGMLFVEVYRKGEVTLDSNGAPVLDTATGFIDGTPLEVIPVIPEFDNGNIIDGEFVSKNGGNEVIYQVPIMECSDLDYGEYYVVICGSENLDYSDTVLDPDDPNWNAGVHRDSYLYLDGIRIFDPLGTDVEEYGNEQNMVFEEIRDQITGGHILVSDFNESGGVHVGTALTTWTEKYNNADYTGKNTYVGNTVTNVNDYLMDGPNNEVYLDGTFHNGALVMYVHQTPGADNILQLGVRALDAGLYFGAGSTGMRANLMLGVMGTTASGTTEPGWHYITTVSSGTEQYYSIPYTLAPVVTIGDSLYHQVVIKVASYDAATPAMVSFTNIKRSEGLTLCENQFLAADPATGTGNLLPESIGHSLLERLTVQMSAYRSFNINEAEPGSDFVTDAPVVPEENKPAIIPGYPSLTFEGEVRYNIYFNAENMDDVSVEDMGLITFGTDAIDGTIADAVDVIPGALFSGSNYMVHTNGIAAKNLGDDLYFKVYAKLADGSYVYSSLLHYSALDYAENRLSNSNDPQLKSLVVAMLNYGASAQQFFGYRTDALMNAGLTDEQKALANAYSADMASPVVKADASRVGAFTSTGGFQGGYASVSFTGAFMLNYYFTPDKAVEGTVTMYTWDADTYNSVTELTAENAISVQSMTLNEVGEYVGTVTGMAAKEIGETVYVAVVYQAGGSTYCSGVVSYSIDRYCAGHAANNASNMQELAAATTVYGYYAKNYFAN